MAVLITGGAGFIGSHTCLALLQAGFEIVVVDNESNSRKTSLKRIGELTGKRFTYYQVDLLDQAALNGVFSGHSIEAVIHFAGLKGVGESVEQPLRYYDNNLTGTLFLCKIMEKHGVTRMVFSSSAAVYGVQDRLPLTEDLPLNAINPFGRTKLMIEQILRDAHVANPKWAISLLRYFNPIGAHESGQIGEDPNGIPNNLVPYITQVAAGKLTELKVFGNDYHTHDGTGVRDYIHVMDLAEGHVKALEKVLKSPGVETYNLGTGTGYSVLEMVRAFEKVSGRKIPYQVVQRRPGDIAVSYADPSKAKQELGWSAQRGLDQMCKDAWRWQEKNPKGYIDS